MFEMWRMVFVKIYEWILSVLLGLSPVMASSIREFILDGHVTFYDIIQDVQFFNIAISGIVLISFFTGEAFIRSIHEKAFSLLSVFLMSLAAYSALNIFVVLIIYGVGTNNPIFGDQEDRILIMTKYWAIAACICSFAYHATIGIRLAEREKDQLEL